MGEKINKKDPDTKDTWGSNFMYLFAYVFVTCTIVIIVIMSYWEASEYNFSL